MCFKTSDVHYLYETLYAAPSIRMPLSALYVLYCIACMYWPVSSVILSTIVDFFSNYV